MEIPSKYIIAYDDEEGLIVWNIELDREIKQFIDTNGYKYLNIRLGRGKRKKLLVHRLTGLFFIPNGKNLEMVDHIDGNPLNNKIENLRWVSTSENNHNRKAAKGYYWHKRKKKWVAQINIDGKTKHLGYFDKESDARTAYESASQFHFEGIKPELN